MNIDLLKAKQTLSARYLKRGFRENVVARVVTMSVADAVAAAGSNVHAVGIGRKIVEGKPTDEMAVRLYVVQKIAPSLLPPRDVLPKRIDGMPTDIIESSPAFLAANSPRRGRARSAVASAGSAAAPAPCTNNRRQRQRPVIAGISVAHRNVTAGTIGYFCRSVKAGDDPNKIFILSNNHVLADVNKGFIGDDIYQPGPADGGTAADHVGELWRFQRMSLDGSPNRIDAAIAELLSGVNSSAEICMIGAITATRRGVEGMTVRKHGRTSGYTEGVVVDESYDALVGMDHNNPDVTALFQDQMRIETAVPYPAFGLGGDSGSLVVDRDGPNAVGLYFAGPASGIYGIANHIADVLTDLQVELLT